MSDRITVERMYAVAVGGARVLLVESSARELYNLLHAEFGEKKRGLKQLRKERAA